MHLKADQTSTFCGETYDCHALKRVQMLSNDPLHMLASNTSVQQSPLFSLKAETFITPLADRESIQLVRRTFMHTLGYEFIVHLIISLNDMTLGFSRM